MIVDQSPPPPFCYLLNNTHVLLSGLCLSMGEDCMCLQTLTRPHTHTHSLIHQHPELHPSSTYETASCIEKCRSPTANSYRTQMYFRTGTVRLTIHTCHLVCCCCICIYIFFPLKLLFNSNGDLKPESTLLSEERFPLPSSGCVMYLHVY